MLVWVLCVLVGAPRDSKGSWRGANGGCFVKGMGSRCMRPYCVSATRLVWICPIASVSHCLCVADDLERLTPPSRAKLVDWSVFAAGPSVETVGVPRRSRIQIIGRAVFESAVVSKRG